MKSMKAFFARHQRDHTAPAARTTTEPPWAFNSAAFDADVPEVAATPLSGESLFDEAVLGNAVGRATLKSTPPSRRSRVAAQKSGRVEKGGRARPERGGGMEMFGARAKRSKRRSLEFQAGATWDAFGSSASTSTTTASSSPGGTPPFGAQKRAVPKDGPVTLPVFGQGWNARQAPWLFGNDGLPWIDDEGDEGRDNAGVGGRDNAGAGEREIADVGVSSTVVQVNESSKRSVERVRDDMPAPKQGRRRSSHSFSRAMLAHRKFGMVKGEYGSRKISAAWEQGSAAVPNPVQPGDVSVAKPITAAQLRLPTDERSGDRSGVIPPLSLALHHLPSPPGDVQISPQPASDRHLNAGDHALAEPPVDEGPESPGNQTPNPMAAVNHRIPHFESNPQRNAELRGDVLDLDPREEPRARRAVKTLSQPSRFIISSELRAFERAKQPRKSTIRLVVESAYADAFQDDARGPGGGLRRIVELLRLHEQNTLAVEKIAVGIRVICENDSAACDAFGNHGAVSALLACLERYPSNVQVSKGVMSALVTLICGSRRNGTILDNNDGLTNIASKACSRAFLADPSITTDAMRIISGTILKTVPANAVPSSEASLLSVEEPIIAAIRSVTSAIELHAEHLSVHEAGLLALRSLLRRARAEDALNEIILAGILTQVSRSFRLHANSSVEISWLSLSLLCDVHDVRNSILSQETDLECFFGALQHVVRLVEIESDFIEEAGTKLVTRALVMTAHVGWRSGSAQCTVGNVQAVDTCLEVLRVFRTDSAVLEAVYGLLHGLLDSPSARPLVEASGQAFTQRILQAIASSTVG